MLSGRGSKLLAPNFRPNWNSNAILCKLVRARLNILMQTFLWSDEIIIPCMNYDLPFIHYGKELGWKLECGVYIVIQTSSQPISYPNNSNNCISHLYNIIHTYHIYNIYICITHYTNDNTKIPHL